MKLNKFFLIGLVTVGAIAFQNNAQANAAVNIAVHVATNSVHTNSAIVTASNTNKQVTSESDNDKFVIGALGGALLISLNILRIMEKKEANKNKKSNKNDL